MSTTVDITERKKIEQDLRESEQALEEAQSLARLGSWSWEVEENIVNWSKTMRELVGWDPDDPPPSYEENRQIFDERSWEQLTNVVERAVQFAEPYELDLDMRRLDGKPFQAIVRGKAVKDEAGNIVRLHGTVQDITERKKIERELRESEQARVMAVTEERDRLSRQLTKEVASKTADLRKEISEREATEKRLRKTRDELATLMAVSQNIVSTLELNPLFDLILEQLRGVLDYGGAAIVTVERELFRFWNYKGLPLDADLLSLEIPIEAISPMRRVIAEQKPLVIDDVRLVPGLPVELEKATGFSVKALFGEAHTWMCVPLIASDKAIGLLGLTHKEPSFYTSDDMDLAQAFANQAAIALENAQLFEKAKVVAVTEERNRLARELHDSVTQSLYSASLLAEVLPKINQRDPDEAKRGLEELRHLTRGALAEMRTMLLELRPETLIKTPLDELIQQLVEALSSRMDIDTQVDIETAPNLPADVHVNFYRIAQEALNNVIKHSKASQLSVGLFSIPSVSVSAGDGWDGAIECRVEDNGKGFDPQELSPKSLGLAIMRERSVEVGAELRIESRPGHGTAVIMVWEGSEIKNTLEIELSEKRSHA